MQIHTFATRLQPRRRPRELNRPELRYCCISMRSRCALAILMAIVLDTRLVDVKGKQKAYLTASTAIAFAFSLYYWQEATPSRLVKTAVSALLFSLLVGGLGGWAVGGVARALFGPKLPKKAASRR